MREGREAPVGVARPRARENKNMFARQTSVVTRRHATAQSYRDIILFQSNQLSTACGYMVPVYVLPEVVHLVLMALGSRLGEFPLSYVTTHLSREGAELVQARDGPHLPG